MKRTDCLETIYDDKFWYLKCIEYRHEPIKCYISVHASSFVTEWVIYKKRKQKKITNYYRTMKRRHKNY